MRKVIYAINVSLDGFIEDAKGSLNWSVPDEELHQHFNDWEKTTGEHFYGRWEVERYLRAESGVVPEGDSTQDSGGGL